MSAKPQVHGKVLGFRNWYLMDGELRPLNAKPSVYISYGFVGPSSSGRGFEPWLMGENTAKCRHHDHDAPHKDCECGLYAWHGINRIQGNMVAGAVMGWGKVVSHHDGFRAERAEIVALSYSDEMTYGDVKTLRKIAQDNGIVVCEFEQLENVGSEFGTPVPEELRPAKPVDPELERMRQIVKDLNHKTAQIERLSRTAGKPWSGTLTIPRHRSWFERFEDWIFDLPEPIGFMAFVATLSAIVFGITAAVVGIGTGLDALV